MSMLKWLLSNLDFIKIMFVIS